MKAAYFDCYSGVSGDMILGALIDAGLDPEALKNTLAALPLSGYEISTGRIVKNGIAATRVTVAVSDRQQERGLNDILGIIDAASLSDRVKQSASEIFRAIARIEAEIHNVDIDRIHFHEVGAVDSIIDIVGACAGLDLLGIESVYCSSINVGEGTVSTAHGILPVPAPATAALLRGVPVYSSGIQAELATPTGAAIMTHFARRFGPLPVMKISSVGYGAGMKDLTIPNLLRVYIGEEEKRPGNDAVVSIETNIDDMNPEFYGHVIERLIAAGALDAFITPIIMKKGRTGTHLTVLASEEAAIGVRNVIFAETTTAGIRYHTMKRAVLNRETRRVTTRYGEVAVKFLTDGERVITVSPEYEDCRRIAVERDVPIRMVYEEAKKTAFTPAEK
ncbi:MAG: nickel pincer cofactor biosynthesis protein LarC [Spirochaetes bacterium]|nr:nickel pincer cofactor biosynthesis protein LarC [Spirochaetota bacterium]